MVRLRPGPPLVPPPPHLLQEAQAPDSLDDRAAGEAVEPWTGGTTVRLAPKSLDDSRGARETAAEEAVRRAIEANQAAERHPRPGVAPSCPKCKRLLRWTNNKSGNYRDGWRCNIGLIFRTRNGPEFWFCKSTDFNTGEYRWNCPICETDFCQYCYHAPPRSPRELTITQQLLAGDPSARRVAPRLTHGGVWPDSMAEARVPSAEAGVPSAAEAEGREVTGG